MLLRSDLTLREFAGRTRLRAMECRGVKLLSAQMLKRWSSLLPVIDSIEHTYLSHTGVVIVGNQRLQIEKRTRGELRMRNSFSVSASTPENVVDRRAHQRPTMVLRVGLLEFAGKSSFCLLRNISPNGVQRGERRKTPDMVRYPKLHNSPVQIATRTSAKIKNRTQKTTPTATRRTQSPARAAADGFSIDGCANSAASGWRRRRERPRRTGRRHLVTGTRPRSGCRRHCPPTCRSWSARRRSRGRWQTCPACRQAI